MDLHQPYTCSFSALSASSKIDALIRIIEAYQLAEDSKAYLIARKLKMKEMITFRFDNYSKMQSFCMEMEVAGAILALLSSNPNFNKNDILEEFSDMLNAAGEYEIDWDSETGYGAIIHPSTKGAVFIENEFIAQFIAKEMVERGAKLIVQERGNGSD